MRCHVLKLITPPCGAWASRIPDRLSPYSFELAEILLREREAVSSRATVSSAG
jgi:hypothetical protein